MLGGITEAFYRLDQRLQARLGRPYNAILVIGLVGEIGHRLSEAPKAITSMPGLIGSVLVLAMEGALLIHQIGALSHHIKRREAGRRRRRAPERPAEAPAAEDVLAEQRDL
jgi:hypothetical protein